MVCYTIFLLIGYILQSYFQSAVNSRRKEWSQLSYPLLLRKNVARQVRSTGTSSNCMKRKLQEQKLEDVFQAVLALEGQSVVLDCEVCIPMGRTIQSLALAWRVVRSSDGSSSYVIQDDRFKIADDWSLSIKDIDVMDAGQYICLISGIHQAKFQIDVLLHERRKVIKESEKEKVLLSHFLPSNNIEIFSMWSGWSDCNHCGKVGQKRKIGICMIRKIDYRYPISPVDVPMINSYAEGIPCRSSILPKKIAHMKVIRSRTSEVLMGVCKIPCATVPPFITITDTNGYVVEVVEAGFYALKNKPTLPPLVIRKIKYEKTGKHLVLKCPNKGSAGLIRWQNGSDIMNPISIRRQSRARVTLDSKSRLHMRKLRMTDTAVYSCWDKTTLIATIRVIVTKAFDKDLKNKITYAGLLLTVLTVLLILFCACIGQKRQTGK